MNAPDDMVALPDLANEAAIAAVLCDDGGRLMHVTADAADQLGFPVKKLVGRCLADLAADGWRGAVEDALMRMRSGLIDPFEVLLLGRSGRRSLIRMIPRRTQQPGGAHSYVLFWRRIAFTVEPPQKRSDAAARRLTYGLLRRHDEHRGRIASELRHDVASLITVAKLTVENAAGQLQRGQLQDIPSLLLSASERLRETLASVRRISTDLIPSSLDDLGLVATIEWLCRLLKESHPDLRVELQLDVEESSVGPTLKIDLFRIIEEALFNAASHAQASRIRVTLVATRVQIHLNIEDDGLGFDAATHMRGDSDHRGIGLHSIGSRVDATHGSLHVESLPGAGTSVVATWPVDEASLSSQ